jgi:hypothetical protein
MRVVTYRGTVAVFPDEEQRMSLGQFFEDHGQKIYGSLTAGLSTVGALLASGSFHDLVSASAEKSLAIAVAVATAMLGGAVVSRANSVTAKVKVAEAMTEALRASPADPLPEKVTNLAPADLIVAELKKDQQP